MPRPFLAACVLVLALPGWARAHESPPMVQATLRALHRGNPGSADVSLQWPSYRHASYPVRSHGLSREAPHDAVVAYEAQVSVSGSGDWQALAVGLTGRPLLPPPLHDSAANAPHSDRHEKQLISTRVDSGHVIDDGFFRLSLSHAGTSERVLHQRAVTPAIPFDATPAQLQAALESLDVVTHVQVTRSPAETASTDGTYAWTVVFDPLGSESAPNANHGDLPLLSVYAETLSAPYSGAGAQVAVRSLRDGSLRGRVLCDDTEAAGPGRCEFLATALPVARALTFRVRAQWGARSWSEWSPASAPLVIPATPLPCSPSPPELRSATTDRITIHWRHVDTEAADGWGFPVVSYHVQQRCASQSLSWITIHSALARGAMPLAVATSHRLEGGNVSCAFRVAATNANGQGRFSSPSALFQSLAIAPSAPPAITVELHPQRLVHWQAPHHTGGSTIHAYDVEVRAVASSTWRRLPVSRVDAVTRTAILDDHADEGFQLATHTRHVVRVRARSLVNVSAWHESTDFLTDYVAKDGSTVAYTPAVWQPRTRSRLRLLLRGATRVEAANKRDQMYVHGVGDGGVMQRDGAPGIVLLFPVTRGGARLRERTYMASTSSSSSPPSAPLVYDVPWANAEDPQAQVIAVDVYAWGGGGGSGGKSAFGSGGGGAFARGVFRAEARDRVTVVVGGGGRGYASHSAKGGTNGGGDGGGGEFAGGGGGGASEVWINGVLVLVAAGGGGGGSTDYCCAHGGGGGAEGEAEDGLSPDASSTPIDNLFSGLVRDEYHSHHVEGDTRDMSGLPARHQHLDYGHASAAADYSMLATGGKGATSSAPGLAGHPGSFVFSRVGECVPFAASIGVCEVVAPLSAAHATHGRRGMGGRGQDGKEAGGGGGGGFFGGGGGGAGVDGAGGGGGSSFVSVPHAFVFSKEEEAGEQTTQDTDWIPRTQHARLRVYGLRAEAQGPTQIQVSWLAPPRTGFALGVEGFVLEMANRSVNEDFGVVRVLSASTQNVSIQDGICESSWYRFRVKTLFQGGSNLGYTASYSEIVLVQTPPTPVNRWRRLDHARPLRERETAAGLRTTDAPPAYSLPSARRGHTLTALDGFLYLFGGYSAGYECNRGVTAACIQARGVSDELWRFDPVTMIWVPINLVENIAADSWPQAREKHSMALVSGRLLLFGGRRPSTSDPSATVALNDLWSLSISSSTLRTTSTLQDLEQQALPLTDGREVWTTGYLGDAPPDRCLTSLTVRVNITHTCHESLRIELVGPGPSTHPQRQQSTTFPVRSNTYETTWNAGTMQTERGSQRATPQTPSVRTFTVVLFRGADRWSHSHNHSSGGKEYGPLRCSTGSQPYVFSSAVPSSSLEPLSVFQQLSAHGGWSLSVTDTVTDGHEGSLDAWDIAFVLQPCVPSFTWTRVTAASPPLARYEHTAVGYRNTMFVVGGRTIRDDNGSEQEVDEMHRLDYEVETGTGKWTRLRPLTDSLFLIEKRGHVGRALVLTPFELLRLGAGLRPAAMTRAVSLEGVVAVAMRPLSGPQGKLSDWDPIPVDPHMVQGPRDRYWAAAAMVPSVEGTPRVFLFGGQDEFSLLDDLWELELHGLMAKTALDSVASHRQGTCEWRIANAALQDQWRVSCNATEALVAAGEALRCSTSDLLRYAWCNQQYQGLVL